ncbi:uncharacterized protein LOC123527687 [Mercenaria mercenaria]|uniref:uncharacterized protein LOC123527687 n=1 Tax=Mercenaria mercenaria TaxID=6596 RepID=UPI00234F020F|nr:uncharacterized protein LOC123527687 [Mercenaria mercenaria]
MELFYITAAVGVLLQISFVYGLHSSASAATDRTYHSQTNLGGRTMARFRSRIRSPTQTANRGIPRRGRPRFIQRHAFQQPPAFRRNYQTLQNRNVIQPALSQPIARPLVYRPPVNFHRRPGTLRRFDMRKSPLVTHAHEHSHPLHVVQRPSMASGRSIGDGLQQTEKNTLLILLEERRPVIRDENDLLLIRQHLIGIDMLGSNDSLDNDQILDKQVEYIENIPDIDIQREVLKIFVKDIVEKSGFLSENASTVQDIFSLKALVDKISSITDKFTKLSQNLVTEPLDVLRDIQVIDSGLSKPPTTTNHPITSSDDGLRQRIINALSIYDRNEHVPHAHANSINRGLETFQSRQRPDFHPSAGMSIFGDVNTETTTLQSQTTEIKRDSVVTEPLGGNNAYWTHLRAGLVDMLCNLCQRQQLDSCIVRYCTNDMIRTETETPAPSISIEAA